MVSTKVDKKVGSKIWPLAAVLFIAVILRLWKISEVPVSLFGDELDVGYQAHSILKTGRDYSGNFLPLHFQSLAEWRTPLYIYSSVPTVALFGISPLGVRLPAAIFGILGVWAIYLLSNELVRKKFGILRRHRRWNLEFGILPAFLLAVSPWHIQYSRAGFEATEVLAFLLFGLYFFFKAQDLPRYFWVSIALLTFTPWIYSTAKLFTPFLFVFLFFMWRKEIVKFPKRDLVKALIAGIVVGLPIAFSTFLAGGTQRAGHLSIFTDPTTANEIAVARELDAKARGNEGIGINPQASDRFFHNKVFFWTGRVIKNYLQTVSSEFLFIEGDPNLRHSTKGVGQFYYIEAVFLILGIILFFSNAEKKIKLFIAFWLVFGILPAAVTRDGGNHATRTIIVLPALIFLICLGWSKTLTFLKVKWSGKILIGALLGFWLLEFVFYQHTFWIHNPRDSERWWHYGFGEAIQSIKEVEKSYDRIIISMAGEPAWIFFAGFYQYPPEVWQKNAPLRNDVYLPGFGKISHIDKFYFGTFGSDGESIYDLPKYIDDRVLYLSLAKEIGANLVREPQRTPPNLKLINVITYPSGEPAFYLFSGTRVPD